MGVGKRQIYLLAIATGICLTGDSMLYVALPIHWQSSGLTYLWQVGLVLSINRIIRIPLGPLIGWIYGKFSKKRVHIFTLTTTAIVTFGYAFATSFLMWICLRCIWGLLWTLLRMGAYVTITDFSSDENRGYHIGLYNGLYRIGSLFGMLLGGALSDLFDLRTAAVFFGFTVIIAVPFFVRKFHVGESHADKIPHDTNRLAWNENLAYLKTFKFNRFLISGLLISMVYEGMFSSTLSHVIKAFYGSQVNVFGFLLGAATLSGILQSCRWGWGPWLAPWIGKMFDRSPKAKYHLLRISLSTAVMLYILAMFRVPLLIWSVAVLFILITSSILTTALDAIAMKESSRNSPIFVITLYTVLA